MRYAIKYIKYNIERRERTKERGKGEERETEGKRGELMAQVVMAHGQGERAQGRERTEEVREQERERS